MRTLDEVIDCAEKWTENFDEGSLEKQMLFYLKMYRSDSRQWEADRKNWENIRFTAVDEYNEARDRLVAKCKALEIGTLNEPLSWNDLLAIAGQPVWVECAEETHIKPFWGLVGRYTGHSIPFYTLAPIGEGCSIAYGHKNDMGINWIAYRKERI